MAVNPRPAPVERKVAREAAQWYLRLQGSGSNEADHQACANWRQAHQEHERAWQLAVRFSAQVQALPTTISRTALQRPTTMDRRTAIKGLTSLVILGSLGLAVQRSETFSSLTADVSTRVGELRHMTLADGTEIRLNTDSALDIRYSDTLRLLLLRKGEVYIRTAKDSRPLHVQSARGLFEPIGTRFILRQLDDHDRLSVIEGAVAATPVEAPDTAQQIHAGEQATITSRRVIRSTDTTTNTDWLDGVLRPNRMRLAQVIAELGRYRHGWTHCAPEVADRLISGTFQLNDIDAALAALTLAFPLRLRYVTRYWVSVGPV